MSIYSWPCSFTTAEDCMKNAKQAGWTVLHMARCVEGEYKGLYVVIGIPPKRR